MSKSSNTITAFAFFLILAILLGLCIKTSIDMIKQTQEPQVSGVYIQFENGTTEPEVNAILENYNITENYTIDYDSKDMLRRYYITVDQDKKADVINELKKDENLTFEAEIRKENYNIIILPEEFIADDKFIAMLKKNNLQLKQSILCYIRIGDGSTDWISEEDAIRIKNGLETNEKVLNVFLSHFEY